MAMNEWEWHEVKKYFRKILNSVVLGLLWMLAVSTAGLYFKLGLVQRQVQVPNIIFYAVFILSFAGLLWVYYKMWK